MIAQLSPPAPRSHVLLDGEDLTVELTHYPGGLIQPSHRHSSAQLSFLLAGGFAESSGGRDFAPAGPQHRFQPAGSTHGVRFGANGAVILAFEFRRPQCPGQATHEWHPSASCVGQLAHLLFAGVTPADDTAECLLAIASQPADSGERKRSAVPTWLRSAADHIADDPLADITAVAASAGVHRVHLSRSFQRHFGLSPVQYRLYCKCSLALRHLVEGGEPAAIAAQSAGFADQSHWTRACRAIAGIGPGRIRRLLAA